MHKGFADYRFIRGLLLSASALTLAAPSFVAAQNTHSWRDGVPQFLRIASSQNVRIDSTIGLLPIPINSEEPAGFSATLSGVDWIYQNTPPIFNVEDFDNLPQENVYLITDGAGRKVFAIRPTDQFQVLDFSTTEAASPNFKPVDAFAYREGGSLRLLITDQDNHRVLRVDFVTKLILWQYGGTEGSGFDQLSRPSDAVRLPDSARVLICDTGNNRVILLNEDTKDVVWNSSGVQLNNPVDVEYSSSENAVLITDQSNHRVILVSRATNTVIWQFGITGVPSSAINGLRSPADADLLPDGTILICDTGNKRLIQVNRQGQIVWSFHKALNGLVDADRLSDNRTLAVFDNLPRRLAYKNEDYISTVRDLGRPVNFDSLYWQGQITAGVTSIRLQLRSANILGDLETAPWLGPGGEGTYYTEVASVVNAAHDGSRFYQFKASLETSDVLQTPMVTQVRVVGRYFEVGTPGIVTSEVIADSPQVIITNWSSLLFNTILPSNPVLRSQIQLDVRLLDATTGAVLHTVTANTARTENLSDLKTIAALRQKQILRLQAVLNTNNSSATPVLNDWRLTWEFSTVLPPAPPQNLQATPGIAQVTLTWSANTESDFLRYRIYGGTSANPTTQIDSVDGANNTAKTISNLMSGTTYYFRLTAVDQAMQASGYSNTATATPLADATPPVFGAASYSQTVVLNNEVPISITVSDVSGVKNVVLYYRAGGAAAFSSQQMSLQTGGTYAQTIPASSVTNRGVEFYVRAEDTYGNFAQTVPYAINVICVSGITNPAAQPGGTTVGAYRLFSVPLDLDDKSPAAFLSANPSLGAYDNTRYRWYAFDRTSRTLHEYPDFANITMAPDMGFALLVNISNVKLATGSGKTVATSGAYIFALPQGWSLIGNPFNFNVHFDSLGVSVGTFELWSFEGDWQINARGLEAWKGYAVYLSQVATFSIRPGVAGLKSAASFYTVDNNDAQNWLIQITADNGRSKSRFNFAGQHENADDDIDVLDCHLPPRIADQVAVVFTKENAAELQEPLKADIREPSAAGHAWEFTCLLNPQDEVLTLQFDGVQTVPHTFEVILIDTDSRTAYAIRSDRHLQFATRHLTEKRFKLIAGTNAYVQSQSPDAELYPSDYSLMQNFPNPFNSATQIVYSLPQAGHVELSVYNLRGELVTTLVNQQQEIGSHTVIWNAAQTSSGIYFIELRAGKFSKMQKCMLIR